MNFEDAQSDSVKTYLLNRGRLVSWTGPLFSKEGQQAMELWTGCPSCGHDMLVETFSTKAVYKCSHCPSQGEKAMKRPTPPLGGFGGYERPLDAAAGVIRGLFIGAAGWAFLWWYFR